MAPNKRRSSKGGAGGNSGGGGVSSSKASLSTSSADNNRSKKRSSKNSNSLIATSSTIQAAGVLVLAIITALVWNSYNNDPVDPVVYEFLNKFCNMDETYCNPFLIPFYRTQKTTSYIPAQQRIVQVPRSLMIIDLDALRSPFIRQEFLDSPLLQQQQQQRSNSLKVDAFLAVHLALLQQTDDDDESSSSSNSSSSTSSMHHPLLLDYVRNIMPSYQDFVDNHPILWPDEHLRELFGVHTATYHAVRINRKPVQDEYQIFSEASKTFAQQVSWKQYIRARLCVMTRSFGMGPLQPSEQQADSEMTLMEEFALYSEKLGLNFEQGSRGLVPVLDLYNHHAPPSVEYGYDNVKRAFVSTSLGIPAGHEVIDSYGRHTDVHLFARYGFVSADGSEHSQSHLAIWHDVYEDIMDPINYMNPDRVVARSIRILHYLQFDDGYHECITEQNNPDAYQLKILKFIKLSQMAHKPTSFMFLLGPRNKHATAPSTSQFLSPSMTDLSDHESGVYIDGMAIFGTCRLLTLTHHDYNGSATQMLQHNLYNDTYILPTMPRDPLEFRTILCVIRLAREALRRFNVTVQQQKDVVLSLTSEQFRSRTWMAAHLRLSEMQNLDFLVKLAFASLQNFPSDDIMDLLNSDERYRMRDEPCPPEVAINPYLEHHLKPPTTVVGGDDDKEEEKTTTEEDEEIKVNEETETIVASEHETKVMDKETKEIEKDTTDVDGTTEATAVQDV